MAEKVLLVEDDPSIQQGLELNLRLEGYEVFCASDGEEGLRAIRERHPDLVVLDIMLPKLDGFRVIEEVRAADPDLPILVLSAKGHEADKVLGLSLGADDYLTKPFGLAELLARVRAGLRRRRQLQSPPAEPRVALPADLEVDLASRRVVVRGREVEMTAREFDLLRYFLARPAVVFTREQLMHAVWGPQHYGTPRTVDNFVARLRAKIEEDPEAPRHLLTVRGVGYRFDP